MGSRALGLDVGDRRIGVAISDPEGLLAVPLTTVRRLDDRSAVESVAGLVEEYGADPIVVGLPALLSGEMGEQAEKVRAFAERLRERVSARIEWWDERLSTVSAEKMLRDAGARRERREAARDALAAALVLQSYLDAKRTA